MIRNYAKLLAVVWVCLSAASSVDSAERFRDFGPYLVYFNAVKSDYLAPEIARAYGIRQSSNRAFLNIAVLKKAQGGGGLPVQAKVTALATNLNGQLKHIAIRPINDRGAIYHIGELRVDNGEILDFRVRVSPPETDRTFTITFREQFFTR